MLISLVSGESNVKEQFVDVELSDDVFDLVVDKGSDGLY